MEVRNGQSPVEGPTIGAGSLGIFTLELKNGGQPEMAARIFGIGFKRHEKCRGARLPESTLLAKMSPISAHALDSRGLELRQRRRAASASVWFPAALARAASRKSISAS